jgi:hypothetical protein
MSFEQPVLMRSEKVFLCRGTVTAEQTPQRAEGDKFSRRRKAAGEE